MDVDAREMPPRGRRATILTLGEKEIAALIDVASALIKAKVPSSEMRELMEKTRNEEIIQRQYRMRLPRFDAMRSHAGLDGALFGENGIGIALSRVDSAVHVGHALTTHAIQSSVDFFSAQDQLLDVRPARPAVRISARAN